MKSKNAIFLMLSFFLLLLITDCKEELVVESKKENIQTSRSILAKENVSLSMVSDSLSKKEKVAKLKKEQEKPYVVIDKPEKLLSEYLKSRNSGKSLSKSSNSNISYSTQSTQSCYTIEIDVWVFEKYHPISGLIVGILPKGSEPKAPSIKYWQYDQNILSLLKNKFGFSQIIMEPSAVLENTTFAPNQIIMGIKNLPSAVSSFNSLYSGPALFGIFIDEPYHNSTVSYRDSLRVSKLRWQQKMGISSKFIAGETCEGYANEFDDLVDYVNMTAYTDMISNFLVTCVPDPTDNDQRDEWTDFNTSFGSKFNFLWISGELDRGEMDQLIGHAQNMGKNSIWLYAGELGMSDQSYWDAIGEFNYYAFMHGYLKREERRFVYVWSYIGNGDPCYDNQDTSWDITDIIDTGETRIR